MPNNLGRGVAEHSGEGMEGSHPKEDRMARTSRYARTRDEILESLRKAEAAHSQPPTVRDLAEANSVGVATMHSYLQKLAEEGMVEWRQGRHRSLRLTQLAIRERS